MNLATYHFNLQTAGATEMFRIDVNERMAEIFEQADFIFAATNPDVAFDAAGPMPTTVGDVDLIAELRLREGRRQQRGADHPGQPDRQSGGVHPGGHRRRPAGGHAGHRPPPRGAAAARPGPRGRARAALAAGGPVRPGVTVDPGRLLAVRRRTCS